MAVFNNKFATATAALVLGLATTSAANAAGGVFTVDPSGVGYDGGSVFEADFINGGSTARIVLDSFDGSNYVYTSAGYIQYAQFQLNSVGILGGVSGVHNAYILYAWFDQTFSCSSPLNVGITCDVTSVNVKIWADPGALNQFTAATLASDPTVLDLGASDILIATADTVYSGEAGLNSELGAYQNVTTNFELTEDGARYFIDPYPFYNIAFSNFNNTKTGVSSSVGADGKPNGLVFAITNENGGSDFNRVPEPGALALFGLGLLGIAGTSIRRRRNV